MKQPMKSKRTITLTDRSYQPGKAELREKIKVDVPGRTADEKMENFARAILRPANIKYQPKQ